MDVCDNCKQLITKKNMLCKFCSKYFCCITCLMAHSSMHSQHKNLNSSNLNSLANTLKKTETMQYPFLTHGIFTVDYKYDPIYDLNNFTREFDGIIPIELGFGSFGRVYLVTHNLTHEKYALKVINKRKLIRQNGNCKLIHNEIDVHSKLNHENIIRLYNAQETDDEIEILLEYAKNGTLYDLIPKETGLDELKAYEYFIQVVNAVYFLHQNSLIHRDIKPENILIGENNVLKLCDFGWAKECTVNKRMTFCGTVEYMAPEIVGSEKYDFSVDIWSLGILLYELVMGYSPFRSKKEKNIMVKIKQCDLVFDKNKNISKECIDLIKGLLDVNPATRFKLKDIFNHPFISSNYLKAKKNKKGKRRESLDDSNENIIKFFNMKNLPEKFKNLKKKFGFENKLKLKSKCSSKQVMFGEFNSEKKLIYINGTSKDLKLMKKNSDKLEKLRNQMNDELKKGKKKIDLLSFNKGKQFSFEDLRDNKNQMMDDDNNKIADEPIMEEEQMVEESSDEDKKETNDNTYHDNFNEANDTFNKDEIIEDKKEQE